MSGSRGFYLMHRGWMDCPALGGKREIFNRRCAWVWLIEEASWSDRKVTVLGKTVTLERGQLCHSVRFMADAWKWSSAAVQRFIDRLKTDTMIEAATDTGQLLITICNYDIYQASAFTTDTPRDTGNDTRTVHERYTSGTDYKEIKEGKEKTDIYPPAEPLLFPDFSESQPPVEGIVNPQPSLLPTADVVKLKPRQQVAGFEEFYRAYPKKVGRGAAQKAYQKALSRATHEKIMAGLKGYVWHTEWKFIPLPTTWLNQDRWADEAQPAEPKRVGAPCWSL